MFDSPVKPVATTQKQTINILLANDHEILLKVIRMVFKKHAQNLRIRGEAGTFADVLTTLIKIPADILLLDNIMFGGDVFDILQAIKKQCPQLKIIIITMYNSPLNYIKRLAKLTEGCLSFSTSPEDMITAIETVYCGGHYFHVNGFEKKLK